MQRHLPSFFASAYVLRVTSPGAPVCSSALLWCRCAEHPVVPGSRVWSAAGRAWNGSAVHGQAVDCCDAARQFATQGTHGSRHACAGSSRSRPAVLTGDEHHCQKQCKQCFACNSLHGCRQKVGPGSAVKSDLLAFEHYVCAFSPLA